MKNVKYQELLQNKQDSKINQMSLYTAYIFLKEYRNLGHMEKPAINNKTERKNRRKFRNIKKLVYSSCFAHT